MGSLFKRGYEASRKEIAKQEERSKQMSNQLFRFYSPKPNKGKPAESEVVFLTEDPVNFEEHTIRHADGTIDNFTCKGKGCPLCADNVKKTAKAAYLLIDFTHYEYTNKEGKKIEGDERLKLYVQGMRAVGQLDRIHEKRGGISNREMTIVRMGTGTSTTYSFEAGDELNISKKHIAKLMPESMAEEWDGTKDGLMDIIEDQLIAGFPEDDEDSYVSSNDFGDDDDDDFEVAGDSDDEEEEPKPKKKSKLSSKLGKKGSKKKSAFRDKPAEGFMDIDDDDDDNYIPFA